jgi:Rrf2 family protein
MFTQKVEYALRAVVHLAAKTPAAQTTEQIAAATRVPPAYLAKILRRLARKGVVRARRGRVRGGITLVKPPEELSLLEVVEAVDPILRIRECPLGLAAHGMRLCPLHKRLDAALAAMEDAFRSTTLAEILAEPSESIPLCDFPVQVLE